MEAPGCMALETIGTVQTEAHRSSPVATDDLLSDCADTHAFCELSVGTLDTVTADSVQGTAAAIPPTSRVCSVQERYEPRSGFAPIRWQTGCSDCAANSEMARTCSHLRVHSWGEILSQVPLWRSAVLHRGITRPQSIEQQQRKELRNGPRRFGSVPPALPDRADQALWQ